MTAEIWDFEAERRTITAVHVVPVVGYMARGYTVSIDVAASATEPDALGVRVRWARSLLDTIKNEADALTAVHWWQKRGAMSYAATVHFEGFTVPAVAGVGTPLQAAYRAKMAAFSRAIYIGRALARALSAGGVSPAMLARLKAAKSAADDAAAAALLALDNAKAAAGK